MKSMQCSTNFFFRETWPRGWQEPLCKDALLNSSESLGWKDETFYYSLGFERRLFKSIQIFLEDGSCNTHDFLIRNLFIVLGKE